MKKKSFLVPLGVLALSLLTAAPAFAHAVVKPNQAGVAAFTDFSLGVPSEKDASTVGVRLLLPPGLNFVTPIVKPGWKIDVKQTPDPSGAKDDDGNPAMIVSEIDWSGGSVPAHQKDFFMFSAQVPTKETELDWKVTQSYSDGTTVSWDQDPKAAQPKDAKGNMDFSKVGPYSVTKVVDDLSRSTSTPSQPQANGNGTAMVKTESADRGSAGWIAYIALALAAASLALSLRGMMKPKQPQQM